MKNKIIILGLLFSITFSSCTDWLDPKPLDSMVLEDFWKTNNDVESVVLACYEAMTTEGFMQRVIISGEVRSDNVTKGINEPDDKQELKDILNVATQTTNRYAKWLDYYKVINYCNSVIKHAPDVQALDPDYTNGKLRIHLAEAKTIRALVYFYLVRTYKDVPFITEPYVEDTQKFDIPQSEGDSILKILVEDLIEAERGAIKTRGNYLMNSNFARQTKGRITKNAVRAILADIYLWLEEYNNCIDACDRVLADEIPDEEWMIMDRSTLTGSELYLVSNAHVTTNAASYSYSLIFSAFNNFGFTTGNSPESIFELQFNSNNKGRVTTKDFYGSSNGSNRWLSVSALNDWGIFNSTSTDLRQKDFYYTDPNNTTSPPRILKYVGERNSDTSSPSYVDKEASTNWIFYRLPDIMLMKAEALTELNGDENLSAAFQLVNRLYKRSNPTVQEGLNFSSYNSQEEMRKLVLLERQREFLFEGKRWFDLLRAARREGSTSTILSQYLIRNYSFNADIVQSKLADINAFYLPIHKDELIANPSLKQNSYYVNALQEDDK